MELQSPIYEGIQWFMSFQGQSIWIFGDAHTPALISVGEGTGLEGYDSVGCFSFDSFAEGDRRQFVKEKIELVIWGSVVDTRLAMSFAHFRRILKSGFWDVFQSAKCDVMTVGSSTGSNVRPIQTPCEEYSMHLFTLKETATPSPMSMSLPKHSTSPAKPSSLSPKCPKPVSTSSPRRVRKKLGSTLLGELNRCNSKKGSPVTKPSDDTEEEVDKPSVTQVK